MHMLEFVLVPGPVLVIVVGVYHDDLPYLVRESTEQLKDNNYTVCLR